VSRGYVHVIGNPRSIGKSETGGSRQYDSYDLIEWIAAQPWCDGQVGMIGISGFGAEQFAAAKLQPPHLKAIFPFDPRGAYGEFGGFRDEYPGGVLHLFRFLLQGYAAAHQQKGQPKPLPPEREKLWQEAVASPDYQMYPHVWNVVAQKGQHLPAYFDVLVDPCDKEAAVAKKRGGIRQHQDPDLHWFRLVRLHVQDPSQWRAELVSQHQAGSEEADVHRAGAPRSPVQGVS
jgi:putative hydrolase, CocE/NonD family